MDIVYSRLITICTLGRIFHHNAPGRVPTCHRVDWNAADVPFGDQVLQRLRCLMLIDSVPVDGLPQDEEVVFEGSLFCTGFVLRLRE
jgi:hypothetical protein